MYRLNPDCWVWWPRPPLGLLPEHPRSLTSAMLSHQEEEEEEEEEEEAGEHPAVCCYTTVLLRSAGSSTHRGVGGSSCSRVEVSLGNPKRLPMVRPAPHMGAHGHQRCDDIIRQSADAQWSTAEPAVHSGIPSSSGLAGRGPGAPSSQQPKTVIDADGGDVSQCFIGGRCWEGPRTEAQGCVCVYGQREPQGLGPCWPGSPYVYYGVRRNLVVAVEVVEEVAVEDTLELITEEVYSDDLLGPELLQNTPLYPT